MFFRKILLISFFTGLIVCKVLFAGTDGSLIIQNTGIQEGRFVIEYILPYDGMVELKILNNEEKIIWRNQYNKTKGEHIFKVDIEKIHNAAYYEISYKGNSEKGRI